MAAKLSLVILVVFISITQVQSANMNLEQNVHQLMERMSHLEQENAKLKRDLEKSKEDVFQGCQRGIERLAARLDNVKSRSETSKLSSHEKEHTHTSPKRLLFQDGITVAFTAVIKPTYVRSFNNGETIVFETVLTNIGGAYNSNDGIFVAPVNGLYMISCSVLDDYLTETKLHAEIVANDVPQARIFAYAEKGIHRDQGAQTILLQLKQGDHVRVRHIDEDNGTVGGELYTSFSGYLLQAFE